MDLDILINRCHQASKAKGFWDDFKYVMEVLKGDSPAQYNYEVITKLAKLQLVNSELGEATEGIRSAEMDGHCPHFTSEEIEVADAVIRICDYAGAFDLRLVEAIAAKLEYNQTRGYKHGKSA